MVCSSRRKDTALSPRLTSPESSTQKPSTHCSVIHMTMLGGPGDLFEFVMEDQPCWHFSFGPVRRVQNALRSNLVRYGTARWALSSEIKHANDFNMPNPTADTNAELDRLAHQADTYPFACRKVSSREETGWLCFSDELRRRCG